uniref:Uncharacterized protein n=1 Tax=Salvator merianae TaxID=96440 RepID=A0A8D0BJ97_SALMN
MPPLLADQYPTSSEGPQPILNSLSIFSNLKGFERRLNNSHCRINLYGNWCVLFHISLESSILHN